MDAKPDGYDDARIWAAAQLAEGGPADFVRKFLRLLAEGRYEAAKACLDPAFDWGNLADMHLEVLQRPGWGMSGRPRKDPDGREIVRFVYMEGQTEETLIDRPTILPGSDFVVRETEDGGWLIYRITIPPKV